jgi:Fusaric acid resistance protein-like
MNVPTAHQRRLAGLARSARAAIVVPLLFALALVVIEQPEMAGAVVFGTFAHLVLVNYDTTRAARFAQSAMLTLVGAITVSLGTLASGSVWLAVSGTVAVAFLSELPFLASGRTAAIRRVLLLAFLFAVAVPAPVRSLFPYLAGWLMAGLIAQPALLLIWIPQRNDKAAEQSANSCERAVNAVAPAGVSNWMGKAVRSGLTLGLAVLFTRVLKVEHAFWVVLGVLPVLNAGEGLAAGAFWQEQAGTLIGFSVSAVVVLIIGAHQAWYWLFLPFVVFGSTYAASAIGLMAGQAAFTLFAVVLFCILMPQQKQTAILRLEDIAIGGAVSFAVGALLHRANSRSVDRLPSAAKA